MSDDRIAQELRTLGEVELSDEELRFVRAGAKTGADSDVATVATLVELASPSPVDPELSELSRRRVWNRVADRMGLASDPATVRRGVVRTLLAGIAMAASVAAMVRVAPDVPPPPDEEERAALQDLGEQVRASVQAIDDRTDSERARALADEYAQRLRVSAVAVATGEDQP